MKNNRKDINRRTFFKAAGAVGLTGAAMAGNSYAEEETTEKPKNPQVPKRPFGGHKDEKVPCLGLGTVFDTLEKQVVLRKAYQWGVRLWDTSSGYVGGNSELGIGRFIKRIPDARKNLFISTKAFGARGIDQIERKLQTSLERMNTDYIDLYHGVHGLSNPNQLTDDLRKWAENAKQRKLIRYFGFSCHKNMAKCLTAAAECGWIDAVIVTCNFRVLQDEEMQKAVEKCYKAGVAILAMKTQAKGISSEKDKELAEHFLQRGFTEGQAKLKILWQDKRISTACVGRDNLEHLTLNIAAALDKTELSAGDAEFLRQYADKTCDGYCAGCAEICDSAVSDAPYISEIMRYLMYHNSYGEKRHAKELFAKIPAQARAKLAGADLTEAEARCPQNLKIAQLVSEAMVKLS